MSLFISDQVASVFKRDDDARLIVDETNGSVILETNVADAERVGLHNPAADVLSNTLSALADETLLERSAVAPQRDVRLQVLCRLFVFDTCIMFLISFCSAPLYFVMVVSRLLVWVLVVSCFVGCIAYLVAVVLRRTHLRIAMAGLSVWFVSLLFICGSISGLLNDIAPQLILTMWTFQSLALVLYSRNVSTTQEMQTGTALWIMSGVSLVTAGVFWWFFFIERSWLSFIVTVLGGGSLGVAYRTWEVHLTDATRYALSVEDGMLSFIQFYAEPLISIVPSSL